MELSVINFNFLSDVRNQIRSELQLEKESLVIGHVGRFYHQKNHLFLLDVFARLIKRITEFCSDFSWRRNVTGEN